MPVITVKDCLNCSTDHEWLFDGATLRELRIIKKVTGMSQKQFAEAGDEGDPEALAALLYILHKRDRITVPFDDVDLDFSKFEMKPTDAEQKEMDEYEAAQAAENSDDPDSPKETLNGPTVKAASKPKS